MTVEAVLDTSVAVPLLMRRHEDHERVSLWSRGRVLALCGHALHETFSVLTRFPGDRRVAPEDAALLIERRFEPALMLDAEGFLSAPRRLAAAGVAGGATYDGLVALTALDHDAVLVTLDQRARPTYERLGARTAEPA